MGKKIKWFWKGMFLSLLLVSILLFIFRTTILDACGKFMAPDGHYTADVAILEGTEFIDRDVVKSGIKLLLSKNVKRIVVVLHRISPSHRPFALNEDYTHLVRKELAALGLKENDFEIIVTRINNPVTLTSATGAMGVLSKENVKSAILLSQGFHTRRSYLVYQYLANPSQIKIFPSACFNKYQLGHWWLQEHAVRDFLSEVQKLAYYMARGYIPLKFSY
jgi:hypothetical protein